MKACQELNLTPRFFNSEYSRSSIQGGYELAKELFRKPLDYTAVFAATDSNAPVSYTHLAVAVRALFAAFSRGADQQSANANIPIFDACSVICCFFALFPRKNPAESICSLRDF